MYHSRGTFRILGASGALALILGAATAQAADPVVKCRAAIAKATGKYEQTFAKVHQKCEASIVKGDFVGPCPDADGALKITAAQTKLNDTIAKKCCGEDEACGTIDDVVTPASLGWGSTCSDSANGVDCTPIALADAGDLGACIICNTEGNVNGLIDIAYDSLVGTVDSDLIKCQQEIGAKASKLFQTESKELAKCRAKDLGGGSCPGTSDGYFGKGVGKVAKARQKAIDSVTDKCTDFTTAQIGVPAACPGISSQGATTTNLSESGTQCSNALDDDGDGKVNDGCPKVALAATGAPETGNNCANGVDNDADTVIDDGCPAAPETLCNDALDQEGDGAINDGCPPITPVCLDGTISSTADYLTCVTCVAQRSIFCPECNHCGDGVIQFALGETCDDGNLIDGDSCPSDCSITPCTLGAPTETAVVDVAFEAPDGVSVAALTLFVHYPETDAVISGSGNVGTGMGTPINGVAAGVSVTPNDLDYGLRAVVLEDSLAAITPGVLFTVEMRLCEAQELSDKALACVVIDAADPDLNPVQGVTCSAKQP